MPPPQAHPGFVARSSFSSHDEAEVTDFIRQMYADNTSRFALVRNGARFSALTHDTPMFGADRVHTSIDYSGTSAEGFAAGTSARALQYGFRRNIGTTPLGYLRRVRLEHARRELQEADPTRGDTVAAVATRWGYANPGRSAAAYHAAFGVLPGETLRR